MSTKLVLDNYYLAITFLISLALQGSAFLISFTLQTDKLTDLMGSVNFFVIAIVTLTLGGTYYTRNLVASYASPLRFCVEGLIRFLDRIFVMIWATRLGGSVDCFSVVCNQLREGCDRFLFFRVLKTGKDGRFDEMRVRYTSLLPHTRPNIDFAHRTVEVLLFRRFLAVPTSVFSNSFCSHRC